MPFQRTASIIQLGPWRTQHSVRQIISLRLQPYGESVHSVQTKPYEAPRGDMHSVFVSHPRSQTEVYHTLSKGRRVFNNSRSLGEKFRVGNTSVLYPTQGNLLKISQVSNTSVLYPTQGNLLKNSQANLRNVCTHSHEQGLSWDATQSVAQ